VRLIEAVRLICFLSVLSFSRIRLTYTALVHGAFIIRLASITSLRAIIVVLKVSAVQFMQVSDLLAGNMDKLLLLIDALESSSSSEDEMLQLLLRKNKIKKPKITNYIYIIKDYSDLEVAMVNLYLCHKLNTNLTDYYMYCIIVKNKKQQTLLFQFKKNFHLSRITFQLLKEQFENSDICSAWWQ